jgi:hypothetical protein
LNKYIESLENNLNKEKNNNNIKFNESKEKNCDTQLKKELKHGWQVTLSLNKFNKTKKNEIVHDLSKQRDEYAINIRKAETERKT